MSEPQEPGVDVPPTPEQPAAEQPRKTFKDMNLDPAVQQALDEMGYEVPMEVQTAIYDRFVAGQDLMVQSRTGSGKTAAFGIPIAQKVQAGTPAVQALILAPTRELALQVAGELQRICAYRNIQVVPVYGGAPMGRQIDALKAGAQIVAGTPGRVLDHIRRGTLKTGGIRMLVLDECDEMLSMGFQEEIEKIIRELPAKSERQTLLFSATIPEEIERIGKRHMNTYEKVVLSADFIGVEEIEHRYYLVSGLGRTRDLLKILQFEQPESALIFCNTRDDTSVVAGFLRRAGYEAEAISSDLTQADRERVMGLMKERKLKFLCATDIAARGIDISDLSHVINYTFPESPEVYIHRTGRTGRAGKSGIAISLIGPREIGSFYYLKLLYKIKPEERELPSEAEIKTRREGERYQKIAEEVAEDAGDEWVSLARRIWTSGDGERLVGAVLKRVLDGAPKMVRDRAAEAAAAATTRQTLPGMAPRREGERDERRDRPERREGRGEGRDRDRGGRDRDRGGRDRDRGRGRDRDRPERGERREGRGERGEREARDRGPRDTLPDPTRTTSEERPRRPRPPAPEPGAPPETPKAGTGPLPQAEGREFWEAWVDEKAPVGSPTPPPVPTGEVGALDETISIRARRREEPVEPGYTRLYVNVGRREGLSTEDVTKLVHEALPEAAEAIGKIVVHGSHTYVSVKDEQAAALVAALTGRKVGEREILAEPARR